MGWLSDKVALVTGGARGIGAGIALALGREKVRVVTADILEPENVEYQKLLHRADVEHFEILPLTVNVVESAFVAEMVNKTMSRFGRIDILINAAGVISVAPVMEMDELE